MANDGGVLVSFRDNATDDLLWQSVMHDVPQEDEVLYWTVGAGVTREYEINRVTRSFSQSELGGGAPGEAPPTSHCNHVPIVYVTEQ